MRKEKPLQHSGCGSEKNNLSELLQTLCATEIQTSTCQHKGMATRIGTWQTPQGAHKNSGIWKRQSLGMDVTTRRPTHPREHTQPKGRQREKRITVCMSPVVTVIMTRERETLANTNHQRQTIAHPQHASRHVQQGLPCRDA